jgi:hypothetical protein
MRLKKSGWNKYRTYDAKGRSEPEFQSLRTTGGLSFQSVPPAVFVQARLKHTVIPV